MMRSLSLLSGFTALGGVLGCDSCYGPAEPDQHVRLVRRMQPGALAADYGPDRPLQWGQLNVMHTSDTHGWLAGHIKEGNYGADWGDYTSFVIEMKRKADCMGVDLLLLDSGDLHDGTGLSDTTKPNGEVSNEFFVQNTGYDLLTIGNHELYVSQVAYLTFNNFSKAWGDRYLTSNVEIMNPQTQEWEYIGRPYKYFTTPHGLRVMAFGVLFDFTGNVNITRTTTTAEMLKKDWFNQAIATCNDIDIFLILGHNPAREGRRGSTFKAIHDYIRNFHPDTPIHFFGGHSHLRDFVVYDQSSTASESGRYCETIGWFSMSGFNSSNSGFTGPANPQATIDSGLPVQNPNRTATNNSASPFLYSRRYLDWNRLTFDYHAPGSQNPVGRTRRLAGLGISAEITAFRSQQNLGKVYGCNPKTYCLSCVEVTHPDSLFTFLGDSMGQIIVNKTRSHIPRLHISNTGMARFDLYKGPFTYDDNYVISPFPSKVVAIMDVDWKYAKEVLANMNKRGAQQGRRIEKRSVVPQIDRIQGELCMDPILEFGAMGEKVVKRGEEIAPDGGKRRQGALNAGYRTVDDFGTDGDDTPHKSREQHELPPFFEAKAGFPSQGEEPLIVDLVFNDFINDDIILALEDMAPERNYTAADDIVPYMTPNYNLQDFLLPYAEANWQKGMPDCKDMPSE
ncbi:Metallo-dependent phosphatase-like protein [Podospora australis]|uniref:Metallo-dependent phosphatase-like protein n=1 Tax=Podospora australis TaxID=1536484 RepID=A0AAN6WLD0_9PEZI|nr:Metallo-dependent phosphatase-like protein [Podospora australis]